MAHPSVHVRHLASGDRLICFHTGPDGEVWFRASEVRMVNGQSYPNADGGVSAQVDISLGRDEHILLTGPNVPNGGAAQVADMLWGEFRADLIDAGASE